MYSLSDVLNDLGDFHCNMGSKMISFPGILVNDEKCVMLRCKVTLEDYQKITPYSTFTVWGVINQTPVTLLHAMVICCRMAWGDNNRASVEIEASEIVIGISGPEEIRARKISMTTMSMVEFFSKTPLPLKCDRSIENPAKLELPVTDNIKVDDKYGRLRIYQSVRREWTRSQITYTIPAIIEYEFQQPLEIMDALGKIASVRNFFTFLANRYLPLEHITFQIESSDEKQNLRPVACSLFLNRCDDIPSGKAPFLITSKDIVNDFGSIWGNWLHIYEDVAVIPTLFFEIICNRSTRINRFLNLMQALEVYSCYCRNEFAKKIAEKNKNCKWYDGRRIYLKNRLEDILKEVQPYLCVDECKIASLTTALVYMRNYYTHYERGIPPSYHEMFAAVHLLEYVLLVIVYNEVGIDKAMIQNCKNFAEFQRLDEFMDIVGRYASNSSKV